MFPPTASAPSANPPPPTAPAKPDAAAKADVDYKADNVRAFVDAKIAEVRQDIARQDRDRADWLNILMYHGGPDNHWVSFDTTDNVWRRIPDDDSDYGLPPEIPRSAINIYKRKIDGIASILNQSSPAQEWRPSKDDDAARATAEVADDAVQVLRDECGYDDDRNLINLHVCLTDKVGYEITYDTDERYGMEQIDAVQCQDCDWKGMPMELEGAGGPEGGDAEQTCPECGSDQIGPLLNPTTAEPMGVKYPKGKMVGRIIPTFELSLPPNARECREDRLPYLLTHSWMSRDTAIKLWPKAAGKIRKAKSEVNPQATNNQYASAIRNVSSPYAAARGTMPMTIDAITVYRLVHDPIEDKDDNYIFPEGLDAVMIDGEIIDAGPLPLKDDQGYPMKPIVLRQFVPTPGSPFAIPPADDLGVLQRQRNLLDTLHLLILLHHASPRTYVPLSCTLEDEITGLPNETIRYRSNVPGDKPHTDPGVNPPEALYKAIEINEKNFDDISGLNAILEGQHPEGVSTLGEAQRLAEGGMRTFNAPIGQLIDFEKRLSYVLLQWARQSMWTSRLVRSIGEDGQWELKQFTNADLHGSVDIYVNPATGWPKSQLLQNLRLQDAVKMGAIDPHNPEQQEQILSDYDLTHFQPSMDRDKKQIARILSAWKEAQRPEDIKPSQPFDNKKMHLDKKANFLKTEEAEQMQTTNPPVWQAMVQHVTQLQQEVAKAAEQAAQAQHPPQKPPAPPPDNKPKISIGLRGEITDPLAREVLEQSANAEGLHVQTGTPPPPDPNAKKNPDGSVLDSHLQSGVLRPALGHPDTLEHHLAAGSLRPAPIAPPAPPGPAGGNGGPPPPG